MPVEPLEPEPPLRIVRVPFVHDSAARHVSGVATYVDDLREPERTLHLAVGGAPAARGRIDRMDLSAVRAAPGVVAVLTASDIPGENNVGPVVHDDPVLAEGKVEFRGQPMFAVVAETRDAARRAVKLAKIAIAAEPPLVTVDQALAAKSHVLPDYTFAKGNYTAALAARPRQLTGTFKSGGPEHF